jgi:phosphate transport system substrate-binding protein
MNYGIRKLSTRTKLVAAALALALAGVSHAQTSPTLVGGGATLPSIGYVGTNAASTLQVWGTSTTNTNTATVIAPTSLFGVYEATSGNPNVSYCLTGSGAGKDILASPISLTVNGLLTAFSVQNTCAKNSVGTVPGFGAPLVDETSLGQPNFAGADAPLAESDYQNYQSTNGTTKFPTQFPAVAGAVAIAFNVLDDQGNAVVSANFSDTQLCNIFSGTDSNWNSSDLASAFTLKSGDTLNNSQPINVVYRSDGSGTTFSFSNHLTYACAALGIGSSSTHFVANQTFTTVVGLYKSTIPSNWVGASGNPAVATAIQNTSASIGYVETANALQTNPTISIADVGGFSPTANFNSKLTISAADIAYNSVITGANSTNGEATVATLSSLSLPTPTTSCIALVQPSEYATPGNIVPTGTYPIVAISYLLGNAQGNGTEQADVQGLLESPYNATVQGEVTTIGGTTGLQFLTLGRGSFTAAQVGTCLGE